jgi:hypothetical protein
MAHDTQRWMLTFTRWNLPPRIRMKELKKGQTIHIIILQNEYYYPGQSHSFCESLPQSHREKASALLCSHFHMYHITPPFIFFSRLTSPPFYFCPCPDSTLSTNYWPAGGSCASVPPRLLLVSPTTRLVLQSRCNDELGKNNGFRWGLEI